MDNGSNVASLRTDDSVLDLAQCESKIQTAATDSLNIYFGYYVDESLKKFDYSHLQVLKLIRMGEFTDIKPEVGRPDSCGFTVAFKFGGDSAALHVRGWFDRSTQRILVDDIFMSETLSI